MWFMPLSGPQLPNLQDEAIVLDLSEVSPRLALRDHEGRKRMKFNEKKEAFSVSFEPFSSGLVDGSSF